MTDFSTGENWNAAYVAYAVVICFTFALMVVSIPVGAYTFFFTHLSTSNPPLTPSTPVRQVPIYFGLLTILVPVSTDFGGLFIVLTAIYIVLIVVATWQSPGFFRTLGASSRGGLRTIMASPMGGMTMVLGATLLATEILDYLQSSAGVGTGGLSGDPLDLFLSFTLAPIIEEVGFRLVLIGLPLFLVVLVTKGSLMFSLKVLWRPSAAWDSEEAGAHPLYRSLKIFVYFLVALSSVLFGLAHYLSGAGWQVGKISEAALAGVALGYLYVRYGLAANVLFHWATDYASYAYSFYGQAVYGVPWTSNSVFSNLPAVDLLLLVGLPALSYYIGETNRWLSGRRRTDLEPTLTDKANPPVEPSY